MANYVDQVFAQRHRRRIALFIGLVVLLAVTFVVSLSVGQYTVHLGDLPRILARGPFGVDGMDASVIWQVRIPRLILGILVGAALGVGGALMQAVFANPLAEPSVMGVTSGAGVGAAIFTVSGASFAGTMTIPIGAFVAGLATTLLVWALARHRGKTAVVNLILVGIAVNAVAGATISFLLFLAPSTAREQIIFWQMGTLAGAQWKHVTPVACIAAFGIVCALFLGRKLDLLALGEGAASHVGVNVQRLRTISVLLATLLSAGAVSYAGLIGFVGLVIPHIIRTAVGPSNSVLIPASALGGAALIAVADVVARNLIAYADMPIGIFTALVGGPTFFILLRQMMRKGVH